MAHADGKRVNMVVLCALREMEVEVFLDIRVCASKLITTFSP